MHAYPVDYLICTRTDYGRSDHDHGTIVCHACFDALYPWTTHWDLDHARVTCGYYGYTVRPGGDLAYALVNGGETESTTPEYCDCCGRITQEAYCVADNPEEHGLDSCACRECWPAPYRADDAAHGSGEYARIRASKAAPFRVNTAQDQRNAVKERRALCAQYGFAVPEWAKTRQHRAGR